MISPLRFVLDPITTEEFLINHYQSQALHIQGSRDKFSKLFGWEALNNVLNSSPQPHPGVKMTHGGKQLKPKDAIALIRAVQNGATLILEDIDRYDLNLGNFLNRLSEEIGERTRFNMYLSYPENQGYNKHYDTHSFFILQVSGYKEWWVFQETVPSALFFQKTHGTEAPPEESCYLHCKLGPGDVLYVPQGHWHYAIARDEPSVHLTLAVFVKTGIDFMKWLADELTDYEEFRKTLPLVLADRGNAQVPPATNQLEKIKAGLTKILNESDLYERFMKYRVATERNRQPFQFPSHTIQSLEECGQTNLFKRRVQTASVSINQLSGKVELICAGQRLVFNIEVEPILRFVFSTEEFGKEELLAMSKGVPWEDICTTLLPLVREGFVLPFSNE